MTLGKSLEDYLETILILKIKKGMVRSMMWLIIWDFQSLV